jgi:hypothetical protein
MYDLEEYNIKQEISYTAEKNFLLYKLKQEILKIFKNNNAFIAGGAITSIFSHSEINDYDVFFKTEEDCLKTNKELDIFTEAFKFSSSNSSFSKVAVTLNANTYKLILGPSYKAITIQTISLKKTFQLNPVKIFDSFDFTVCCGLFDFKTDKFYFHPEFFKHLAAKVLVYNTTNDHPITALLRILKYQKKGFTIDSINMLKIAIAIMNLNFKTNKEFVEGIRGMYIEGFKPVLSEYEKDNSPVDIVAIMNKLQVQTIPLLPHFSSIDDDLPY